jgi:hypothetical protein
MPSLNSTSNQTNNTTPKPPKRPISEARLRANRENAKKSTGPRTDQGKHRSRQNAAQHHFTAHTIPLPPHELALLDDCIQQFTLEYNPVGYQETNLVHILAHTQYRLHRLAYAEHHLLSVPATSNTDPSTVGSAEHEPVIGLADVLHRSKDPILTLSIYEQRLMRQYQRILATLLDLQSSRKAVEGDQRADLYAIARCHAIAKVPFNPGEFGFVHSDAEVRDLIKRRVTLDRAHYAWENGFDPAYCEAATRYSAR